MYFKQAQQTCLLFSGNNKKLKRCNVMHKIVLFDIEIILATRRTSNW